MKKQTLLHFTKRFAALAGAAVLTAVTAFGTGAAAAGTNYDTSATTAANNFSFDKYLLMDKGITTPNVDVTFTLANGVAATVAADGGNVSVLAGVGADKVKWNGNSNAAASETISFSKDDAPVTAPGTNVEGFDSTKQYATKQVTIDFTGCGFTEPGVYRYTLTEAHATTPGITNDATPTRYVDVFVEDDTQVDGQKKLKINGYVLHKELTEDFTGTGPASKAVGFTNTYASQTLTVENTVAGNQGSKDKYFEYEVKIQAPSGVNGASYVVDLTGADATLPAVAALNKATEASFADKANPASFKDDDNDGTATATFYLQHGQKVIIKGLLDGSTYTVTVTPEDYTASGTGVTANAVTGTIDAASATAVTAKFTLTRSGNIPTGVIMTVAPFAAVTLLGAAGIVGVTRKKKHEDAEV